LILSERPHHSLEVRKLWLKERSRDGYLIRPVTMICELKTFLIIRYHTTRVTKTSDHLWIRTVFPHRHVASCQTDANTMQFAAVDINHGPQPTRTRQDHIGGITRMLHDPGFED
jgi:hypothetical protein